MLFPIILSFLQICFIPGFIAYILLNRRSSYPNLMLLPVFTFGLSLMINYLIVFFLTYFHIYTKSALIILLVSEFVFLAVVFIFRKLNTKVYSFSNMYNEIQEELNSLFKAITSRDGFFKFALLILSVSLFLFISNTLISDFGKIFASDGVFSWNRWATDFYNNRMPSSTYHYPQLIPTNWSVAYVLCGYPIQFIPHTIMHLFLILPIYTFVVLGITKRSALFYFSAFIIYDSLSAHGFCWTDGFVDVAVSYFAIMVFVSLISMKIEDAGTDKQKYVILGALFACGASVTKQAGLFVVLMYPVLLFILSRNKFGWTYRKVIKFSLTFLFMLIIIVLPYYLWGQIEIKKGLAASEINYVTHDIFNGASYLERFLNAWGYFYGLFPSYILFGICILSFLFSFADKTIRLLTLVFAIPYYIIWALFFSYDIRNVALVIPYFALALGSGLNFILLRLDKPIRIFYFLKSKIKVSRRTNKFIFPLIVILISAGIFLFNNEVSREKLIESQNDKLIQQIGDAEVNIKLFSYHAETPIDKTILTDYGHLEFLPKIGKYYEYCEIKSLDSSNAKFNNGSIGYILCCPGSTDSTKIPEFIESEIKSGTFKEIFNHNGYRFIKIR
jgi:hypothetical protein